MKDSRSATLYELCQPWVRANEVPTGQKVISTAKGVGEREPHVLLVTFDDKNDQPCQSHIGESRE